MEDVKEKYLEQTALVLDLMSKINTYENQEEKLDYLFKMQNIVEKYDLLLTKLKTEKNTPPSRIESMTALVGDLMGIYNRYSDFYFESIVYRRKLHLNEKEMQELRNEALRVQDENEKLKNLLDFLN